VKAGPRRRRDGKGPLSSKEKRIDYISGEKRGERLRRNASITNHWEKRGKEIGGRAAEKERM